MRLEYLNSWLRPVWLYWLMSRCDIESPGKAPESCGSQPYDPLSEKPDEERVTAGPKGALRRLRRGDGGSVQERQHALKEHDAEDQDEETQVQAHAS